MKNNTETKVVITMRHVDHAEKLTKALTVFFDRAALGGDTALLHDYPKHKIFHCGTIGHDVSCVSVDHVIPMTPVSPATGYEPLHDVLLQALNQASHGKGKERHANGKPFLRQPIMEIGRMVGPGYNLGQAMKKCQEATRLPDTERKVAELLGAINYIASAILLLRESVLVLRSNELTAFSPEDIRKLKGNVYGSSKDELDKAVADFRAKIAEMKAECPPGSE